MNRFYTIYKQLPRPRLIGVASVTLDRAGTLYAWVNPQSKDGRVLCDLSRARVDAMAADGILVSGMEVRGFDKDGNQKYTYQELWLAYDVEAKK